MSNHKNKNAEGTIPKLDSIKQTCSESPSSHPHHWLETEGLQGNRLREEKFNQPAAHTGTPICNISSTEIFELIMNAVTDNVITATWCSNLMNAIKCSTEWNKTLTDFEMLLKITIMVY